MACHGLQIGEERNRLRATHKAEDSLDNSQVMAL